MTRNRPQVAEPGLVRVWGWGKASAPRGAQSRAHSPDKPWVCQVRGKRDRGGSWEPAPAGIFSLSLLSPACYPIRSSPTPWCGRRGRPPWQCPRGRRLCLRLCRAVSWKPARSAPALRAARAAAGRAPPLRELRRLTLALPCPAAVWPGSPAVRARGAAWLPCRPGKAGGGRPGSASPPAPAAEPGRAGQPWAAAAARAVSPGSRAGSGGGGGEGVGEGGSRSWTLRSSLPLGTPASDLRRCRDRVLHRPVLWEAARGPGYGDPGAPRGQQTPHRVSSRRDPGRTGRLSSPRAGAARDGDSGRAGRRAAVPSLRPACLASLRAPSSERRAGVGGRAARSTALGQRGHGGEQGAAGRWARAWKRSAAGESACFAFAPREGLPEPAAGAAPPAARPESRFGSGLAPFRGWFGAALRDEGQPLLVAPDPGPPGLQGTLAGPRRGSGRTRPAEGPESPRGRRGSHPYARLPQR